MMKEKLNISITEKVKAGFKKNHLDHLRIINAALIAGLLESERVDYYKRKIIEICDSSKNRALDIWIMRGGNESAAEFQYIYSVLKEWNIKYEKAGESDRQFDEFIDEYSRIIRLRLSVKALSKKRRKPAENKDFAFETLFKPREYANIVEEVFETNGYTENGKWIGVSGNKSELLAAYYELVPLLQPGKHTPRAKAFYQHFGLDVPGYITERSLTNEPFGDDRKEFEKKFNHIVQK